MANTVAELAGSANNSWFNSYHGYDDHLQFLKDLQGQYSSNAEIVTAGKSLEGRPITGIHLYGDSGKGQKPAIVFHGTVHAREWIATMVSRVLHFTSASRVEKAKEMIRLLKPNLPGSRVLCFHPPIKLLVL